MAILIRMRKLADDGRSMTYSFGPPDGPNRTLVFDRATDRVWPEDGSRDAVFRAAAGRLARAVRDEGTPPDSLVYQA